MRIAIDAVPLLLRSAGVKTYLYYWLKHLRQSACEDIISTFPPMGALGPLTHEASVVSPLRTFFGLLISLSANYMPFQTVERLDWRADVFHTTSLLRRPPRRTRLTTTLHDLTSRLFPELHTAANRRVDQHFERILLSADGIIAVSQSSKNDAVRLLRIPEERITVIHSGVADCFFDADVTDEVLQRYGITRPYALFVGTIEPRKNVDTLLEAWQALAPSLRKEFQLVIAGPLGWASAKTKARLSSARYLGYVPETDLPGLTAGAAVFVYPSLYEGFGFPVVQAMAAKVPVITSNVSSLPELAGDAAFLVDPRSTTELCSALSRLLLSPNLRVELAARGRSRAENFRWEACARRSLEFFHKVVCRAFHG